MFRKGAGGPHPPASHRRAMVDHVDGVRALLTRRDRQSLWLPTQRDSNYILPYLI